MEFQTALVAAVAAVLGAGIALLGGLINSLVALKTTREDRQAASTADAERWADTQAAEKALWLRTEKQKIYFGFLEAVQLGNEATYKLVAGSYKADDPNPGRYQQDALKYLTHMLLLAPKARAEARLLFDAFSHLIFFAHDMAEFYGDGQGDMRQEQVDQWKELRSIYAKAQGEFLAEANADLLGDEALLVD